MICLVGQRPFFNFTGVFMPACRRGGGEAPPEPCGQNAQTLKRGGRSLPLPSIGLIRLKWRCPNSCFVSSQVAFAVRFFRFRHWFFGSSPAGFPSVRYHGVLRLFCAVAFHVDVACCECMVLCQSVSVAFRSTTHADYSSQPFSNR